MKDKIIIFKKTKKTFVFFLFSLFIITILTIINPKESEAQLKDVIGVRVMQNKNFLSPAAWYLENVPNPGSPKSMQIDGYEAVVDGRTVYVSATRADTLAEDPDDKVTKSFIYIMSYNEGAGSSVINIFNQLLDNWNFNSNIPSFETCQILGPDGDISCKSDFDCVVLGSDYGPCLSTKGKLRRDTKRIADLQDLKKELESYSSTHSTFPSLAEGTYIPRYSTSKWPSWNETLSKQLGINLPTDPINRFYGDCSSLPGYHPDTCWNEKVKSFSCPSGATPGSVCSGGSKAGDSCTSPSDCPDGGTCGPSLYSYLYVYSARGICSLHCSEPICFGGANNTNPCKKNSDCPDGVCQYEFTCTKDSDCPNVTTGEYCMKSNSFVDIQFNLETDKDSKIKAEYPLYLDEIGVSGVTGGICDDSNFFAMQSLNISNVDCCKPLNCNTLGDTPYTCGTYTNSCGGSIKCTDGDGVDATGKTNNDGVCLSNSSCINGSCCSPVTSRCFHDGKPTSTTCFNIADCVAAGLNGLCTPKECGDNGCGGTVKPCASGYSCDDTYTCKLGCISPCVADTTRCSATGETLQTCGECDSDICLEWCDTTNCASKPAPINVCNQISMSPMLATCGSCAPGDTRPCGINIGECKIGLETCNLSGNWSSVCFGGRSPDDVDEICNGLDDDCDGITDNNLTDSALNEKQAGVCAGSQKKCSGGSWINNYNAIDIPNWESNEITCDGLDNDCSGAIDNGLTAPLNSNQLTICAGSIKSCSGAGGWVDNYTTISGYQAVETLCDGIDNDCNGIVDDTCVSISVQIRDSGSAADDAFSLYVDGVYKGSTTVGASNSVSIDALTIGSHIVIIEFIEGIDNHGTLGLSYSSNVSVIGAPVCTGTGTCIINSSSWTLVPVGSTYTININVI